MIRFLTGVCIAVLLTSCTATSGGSSASSAGEIEEMKRRIVELQQKAAIADVELSRLRQQVANLEARSNPGTVSAPREDMPESTAETRVPSAVLEDEITPQRSEAIEE